MKADIYDVDKLVTVNKLQEITNPIIFDKGHIPTIDGLLSTEIFGRTPTDRRMTYAYIDLGENFLHPQVYKVLLRVDRRIEHIVAGTKKYVLLPDGTLEEDEQKGYTGLPYLYKIFDKIKFKASDSIMRAERLDLIRALKKDELFVNKWVVCPPFYRDVNLSKASSGKVSVGEINTMYMNLIRLSNVIKNDNSGLNLVGNAMRSKLQNELVNIYNFFIQDNIKGKDGIFRKFVLGVSVDYGARLVISSHRFKEDKYSDMFVDFYHSGVPLATCCTIFYPFVLKYVKDMFYNEFYVKKKKAYVNKDGKIEFAEIKNPENLISDEFISKNIDAYIHSYADRFKKIKIPTVDGKDMVISITGYYQDAKGGNATSSTEINRPATWTDILFIACNEVVTDKMILVTRYPIESYTNVFASKARVLSTKRTKPAMVNNKFYSHYPIIDSSLPTHIVSTQFIDTLNISNLYLKGLGGGDYDGDQVSVRGSFTQESNKELEEIMYSAKNILDVSGNNLRTSSMEAIQAIYNFTKPRP